MIQVESAEQDIRFEIGSELYLVDKVMDEVKAFTRKNGVEDAAGMVLVLRELLNNAIEHGNCKDPAKKVVGHLELIGPLRFKLKIADEGQGFDHKELILKMTDDPTQLRNRGLPLVNAYCDELVFNETGNEVEVYFTVPAETGFETEEDGEWKVVRPSGDITATVADKFRALLVRLLEDGSRKFRFDLVQVADIDSITLSIFVVFSNMLDKQEGGGLLEVVGANSDIEDVFNLTRLNNKYRFIQGA